MKKLIALALVAASVAATALTVKETFFKVSHIGEEFILVRDDKGEVLQWNIYKKNRSHYAFKVGRRAVLLPIDIKEGDTVKLYNIL